MFEIYRWVASKISEERGSNGAEYALLIALIAIAIIIGVGAVGGSLNTFFTNIGLTIAGWKTG